jgi:uncharacterized membrane protein YbhN (UPF0104 family)
MIVMFIKSIPGLNSTTLAVGLGAMALAVIPIAIYWSKGRAYFKMPSREERIALDHEIAVDTADV